MIARRYLALVSTLPGDAAARASRVAEKTGLVPVFESARVSVLADLPSSWVPLEGGEGGFVGTLFTTESAPARVTQVPRPMSHAILTTQGKQALKSFWGGYILLCVNSYSGVVSVCRDPSGAMPCYHVEQGTLTGYGSDLTTLVAAGLVRPTIAYPALIRHLAYPDLRFGKTCIEGVADLLPGMRLEIDAEQKEPMSWWSPWDFARDSFPDATPDLSGRLRETVDGCVGAWASCCEAVLVSLSGGLDSSIVASAASNGSARLSSFTMIGDDADSDERGYARPTAQRLGIELAEGRYAPEAVDLRVPSAGHLPWPVGNAHMQPFETASRSLADRFGADALFNGMGGDNVFCSLRSALPVADSVKAGRSLRQSWRTVRDVAELADVTAAAVLQQAARMLVRGRRSNRLSDSRIYLTPDALDQMEPGTTHPWLDVPKGMPPGRAYHVEMIARVQPFVEGFDRWSAPPSVSPLLSQPLLETCLRIPSWRWVAGARNRAVARDGFTGRLPKMVVDRRSKGGPDALSIAVCLQNLRLLRELLLEGDLSRRGLLDRPAVESALTRSALLQEGNYHDILTLADTEAWICHWNSGGDNPSASGSAVASTLTSG